MMTTSTLRGALEARQRQKLVNFLASQNASAELTSLHAR